MHYEFSCSFLKDQNICKHRYNYSNLFQTQKLQQWWIQHRLNIFWKSHGKQSCSLLSIKPFLMFFNHWRMKVLQIIETPGSLEFYNRNVKKLISEHFSVSHKNWNFHGGQASLRSRWKLWGNIFNIYRIWFWGKKS